MNPRWSVRMHHHQVDIQLNKDWGYGGWTRGDQNLCAICWTDGQAENGRWKNESEGHGNDAPSVRWISNIKNGDIWRESEGITITWQCVTWRPGQRKKI